MTDTPNKVTVSIPRSIFQGVVSKKPAWTTMSDEEFFSSVIAQVELEPVFKRFNEATERIIAARDTYLEAIKGLTQSVGMPVDPAILSIEKKKSRPKAAEADATRVNGEKNQKKGAVPEVTTPAVVK